ncbi:sorbosone dehydrogenase family protein [Rufibacter immobilis]|uniref:Sorbosone dehydrogenase family protein n=1 Tax=Rufibacter immobilis TaxID=1348778 RepID=A0A3M9MQX6_9BACT|nr:sorbosone dehydrogenase family protein [Rufibacter immobilis]RNI27909.1 sorbosone dehydrogenase family protein [Rufibacter immobilis]
MKKIRTLSVLLLAGSLLAACNTQNKKETQQQKGNQTAPVADRVKLPPPYATESVKNYSKVIGWPKDKTPQAPAGFTVNKFADGLRNPRWIYVAPNGDIFVAEAETMKKGKEIAEARRTGQSKSQNMGRSANRITLFRDRDQDGVPEQRYTFLRRLNQPFGMLVLNNYFYVANTDGLWRYPYQPGQTSIQGRGEKILELPAGGYNNHWTRNIVANADGSKIYIAVGSGSDHGENGMEHEVRRANILEINPDGSGERIFASGLRNPVGIGWAPGTNTLWAAVNERDDLGDELVPDYLTSVKEGGFYGWPYAYFGPNEDPRQKGKRPDLVKKTTLPEVGLGAHTASLGLAFYNRSTFPGKYRGGAFIGQHGSWNRSELSGYKVVFVAFQNGKPVRDPEDFLTGFIADAEKGQVYGRPVGIAVLPDGSLLVADDSSNTLWRVAAK